VHEDGMRRIAMADRLIPQKSMVRYQRFTRDFAVQSIANSWSDTSGGAGTEKVYVVQSNPRLAGASLFPHHQVIGIAA
jgi:hypothetical protein